MGLPWTVAVLQWKEMPGEALSLRQRARIRIIDPVSGLLNRAAILSIAASLLWPVQAAIIATVIALWVGGAFSLPAAAGWASGFVVVGAARAWLERCAGAALFDAADETVARERMAYVGREARERSETASAAIAAMAVQKLPMLQPWITRYHVSAVRAAVVPLVFALIALSFSWAAALVFLCTGPLIPLFMALIGMAAEEASRRQLREIETLNGMLLDRLSALLDIRMLGSERRALDEFGDRADDLKRRTMAVLKIAFLSSTVLELFAAIGIAMLAVYVGFSLLGELNFGTWHGPLSVWEGIFLLLLAPEFFQPVRELAAAWHDRAAGHGIIGELEEADALPRTRMLGSGSAGVADTVPLKLEISQAVIQRGSATVRLPDMAIHEGDSVAIVGPSGCGKSTVLGAIAGLVRLSEGEIRVDGNRLDEDCADGWRARIAYLSQKPHFPDTTLAAYLDPASTGRDPWPALRAAHATDIVNALPDGLDTRLGDSGGGVSGGEARRLMIARAIMRGGSLLLADEPTADLDPDTAKLVVESFRALNAKGMTIIVATHDPVLSAAMNRSIGLAS
jgi:ATP-binding cassette subfamily C protein CydD